MKPDNAIKPQNRNFPACKGKSLSQPSLKCFLHVPYRQMIRKFLGKLEKEALEICWKMGKIIQWLFFPHQVASLHWKPFNFKIALIASHKLPHGSQPFQRCSFKKTEWIMWKMVCVCFLLEEFLGSGCLKFHGVHSCVSAECALVRAAITHGHRKTEGSLLINEENRRREK